MRAQLCVSNKPKAGNRIVPDDGTAVTVFGRKTHFILFASNVRNIIE